MPWMNAPATTAALVASPAMARDGAWYIGGEFGASIVEDIDFDVGATEDAIAVEPLEFALRQPHAEELDVVLRHRNRRVVIERFCSADHPLPPCTLPLRGRLRR